MKRAAAILGPTPPFLRWAIETPCPFLRMTNSHPSRNPAQTRWRQLRSLKEVARARAEGRLHSGYCFASAACSTNVLGVQIDEVTAPLGGTERVNTSCQRCPANPQPLSGSWAPCTGILPLITPGETLQETEQIWANQLNWLNQKIAAAINRAGLAEPSPQSLNWHLIWQGPFLDSARLRVALQVLELSAERFPNASLEQMELRAALKHAGDQALKIWIESVPVGWSDGQNWLLPAHCQGCGAIWTGPGAGACSSCYSTSSYQAERRLKVLGLRPFIQLSSVLGTERAESLFKDYQSAQVRPVSGNAAEDRPSGG